VATFSTFAYVYCIFLHVQVVRYRVTPEADACELRVETESQICACNVNMFVKTEPCVILSDYLHFSEYLRCAFVTCLIVCCCRHLFLFPKLLLPVPGCWLALVTVWLLNCYCTRPALVTVCLCRCAVVIVCLLAG
jgi:hypothetical protein